MVARLRQATPEPKPAQAQVDETLLLTLSTSAGQVLDQQSAANPVDAPKQALRIISRRPFLNAGDVLKITKPQNGGEVHTPRETD